MFSTTLLSSEAFLCISILALTLFVSLLILRVPSFWRNVEKRQHNFYVLLILILPLSNTLMFILQYEFTLLLTDPLKSAIVAGVTTGLLGLLVNGCIELAKKRLVIASIHSLVLLVGTWALLRFL